MPRRATRSASKAQESPKEKPTPDTQEERDDGAPASPSSASSVLSNAAKTTTEPVGMGSKQFLRARNSHRFRSTPSDHSAEVEQRDEEDNGESDGKGPADGTDNASDSNSFNDLEGVSPALNARGSKKW